MNLQRLRLFLLSLCVFLSVLCSSSHIAHATESDEDIILTYDPFGTSLIDDVEIPTETLIFNAFYYKLSSASNFNISNSPIVSGLSTGTYNTAIEFNLNTYIQPGTYKVEMKVPVGDTMVFNGGCRVEFFTFDRKNIGSYNSTHVVDAQIDTVTGSRYYVYTFDSVEISENPAFIQVYTDWRYIAGSVPLYSGFSYIKFSSISETGGLLKNIITIVNNIKNGITNLPSLIANSIKGFFDNIVNAVTNLGNFLIDGIKGLFVPSSEELQSYFDNWKQLLSDRFGALYEVFDIIISYFQSFSNTASTVGADSNITFPSVSIPLAGTNFVFGGWEVNLVPAGFTIIFDALKLMINVVCTIAFVNSLRRRYDRVVEK